MSTSLSLEKLLNYCLNNKADLTRIEYERTVKSVSDAVKVSGFPKYNFIKTVILRHRSEGNYVIAIITGGSKVHKITLQEGVKPKRWRLAIPEEVLEITGFPVGGVPPICLGNKAKKFVDPRVLQRDYVIGGGGTENSLLRLNPEIIKNDGAEIKVVSFG